MTLASLELKYILALLKDFSALMLSKSSLPIRCTTEETLIILDGADCFSLSGWEGTKKEEENNTRKTSSFFFLFFLKKKKKMKKKQTKKCKHHIQIIQL